MDWLSLVVPFAYLGILVTSLATFSSLYRKRKAQKSLSLSPYFPPHTPRNIYLSLLHLSDYDASPSSNNSGAPTKVPDSLLRAALLARCTEDIHRIIHVRTRKQALNALLKRGCVGEEIWQRLLRAEQELEAEVKDCVQEANAFAPNWGATIFQSANEMANNDMLKKRLEGVFADLPQEKARWETRRQAMREGFMRELELGDQDGGVAGGGSGSGKAAVGDAPAERSSGKDSTATAAAIATAAGRGSSDEDAVMVEKGGDAAAAGGLGGGGGVGPGGGGGGGSGGGGGKSKKKKSKK